MTDMLAVALAIASTIVAAFGMVLFKLASAAKKMFFSKPFFVGGILFVLGTILFVLALKTEELSLLFPVTSLTYIWVMLLSKIFLKERPNRWKIFAVMFIVLGIIFVGQ